MINEIITCVTVLIVGVAVFILIHVCVIGRIFRRDDSVASRNSDVVLQTRRMSSSDINKLPCFDYRMEDGCVESCAVCLENFKEGDKCRFLPICKHTFHGLCIDSWLLKTAACPICRAVPEILSERSVRKSPGEVGAECITSD